MNRKEIKAAQKAVNFENKKFSDEFVEIEKEKWPPDFYPERSVRIKAYRNRNFLVQIFVEDEKKVRLSINRTQLDNNGKWKENITWDDLQDIKRAVGFGDQMAVEIYPRDKYLINVANMRHLWLIDNDTDLGWRK